MTTTHLFKATLLCTVLFSSVNILSAQSSSKTNNWNVSLSYANSMGKTATKNTTVNMPAYYLDVNKRFSPLIELGSYGGLGLMTLYKDDDKVEAYRMANYGVKMNFHIMPLFVENRNDKWDLYLTSLLGIMETNEERYVEYGAGFGVSYHVNSSVSVFSEVVFGNFKDSVVRFRFGVNAEF